jgi:hypothetical protein
VLAAAAVRVYPVDCLVEVRDGIAWDFSPLDKLGFLRGSLKHGNERPTLLVNDHKVVTFERSALVKRRALGTEIGDRRRGDCDSLSVECFANSGSEVGLVMPKEIGQLGTCSKARPKS